MLLNKAPSIQREQMLILMYITPVFVAGALTPNHIEVPILSVRPQLSYSNMPRTSKIDSVKVERVPFILKMICPGKSTIHRYVVKLGLAGMSPLKIGPEGNIPQDVYDALCKPYGRFLKINQINGKGGTTCGLNYLHHC